MFLMLSFIILLIDSSMGCFSLQYWFIVMFTVCTSEVPIGFTFLNILNNLRIEKKYLLEKTLWMMNFLALNRLLTVLVKSRMVPFNKSF